ncbi:MAG: hypothetical protein K0S04_2436 [Herbinix sp.]|nr:hypothetical protein [Herbinix sp.]
MKEKKEDDQLSLNILARIHTDFPEKFGIPRQSNIVDSLKAKIIFEPRYRNPDAVRGCLLPVHLFGQIH